MRWHWQPVTYGPDQRGFDPTTHQQKGRTMWKREIHRHNGTGERQFWQWNPLIGWVTVPEDHADEWHLSSFRFLDWSSETEIPKTVMRGGYQHPPRISA